MRVDSHHENTARCCRCSHPVDPANDWPVPPGKVSVAIQLDDEKWVCDDCVTPDEQIELDGIDLATEVSWFLRAQR